MKLRPYAAYFLLFCSLAALPTFAKDMDKNDGKGKGASGAPAVDPTLLVQILTEQRDTVSAIAQATPADMAVEQHKQKLQALINQAEAGVDHAKWKLNYQTLKWEAAPPAPPQPAQNAPKPAAAPAK